MEVPINVIITFLIVITDRFYFWNLTSSNSKLISKDLTRIPSLIEFDFNLDASFSDHRSILTHRVTVYMYSTYTVYIYWHFVIFMFSCTRWFFVYKIIFADLRPKTFLFLMVFVLTVVGPLPPTFFRSCHYK